MENNEVPRPPREGIVYGEIAYWLLLIGMMVAIVGSVIYIASQGYVDKTCLLTHLWQGDDIHAIWEECAGASEVPQGHWYLGMLSQPDAIAMLGIAISCIAAVFGMWGAFFQMLRSGRKLYLIFALIIAVILTLSALGIISLEH
jgi:hypothetical protein